MEGMEGMEASEASGDLEAVCMDCTAMVTVRYIVYIKWPGDRPVSIYVFTKPPTAYLLLTNSRHFPHNGPANI